ncbi:MAG: hypothetical protein KDE47_27125 [Caldilineaceae bacterium]|nr:hypothetical protein [Caldilineaceae bacterium]
MQEPTKQRWERVTYTDNPALPAVDDLEIVVDFLPSPEKLQFLARQPIP